VRQHGQLQGPLMGARRYKGTIDTGKVYEQKLVPHHAGSDG
jgi:hypothetical protein